jgi:CheY-like chemotaxis protein
VDAAERPKVLIVDDEHVVADTLVMVFSRAAYDARAAYSAEEALALIATWTPHLAIIDIYLPAMNGIDLAIRLKAEYPRCRISLFSGEPGAGELLSASGSSFEVVAKPVPPSEMLAIASRLLDPLQDQNHDPLPNGTVH